MSEVDFARITAATILIPIAVAIWQRKSLNEPLRVFFWYRVFALLFNIVQHLFFWFANKYYEDIKDYLDWWGIQDTSFLSILFYINDFIFIGWFYYLLLRYNRYGNYIKWLSTILLIIVLINYLFIEGYQIFGKFNPTAVAIFCVRSGILLFVASI
ncbi:MAG: hypothetical protein IPJ74_25040 [Saprospiraceae bacterium]|nr:hypothetical protein [Saprospiraceae bacterium]